jgi:hypothetical protein
LLGPFLKAKKAADDQLSAEFIHRGEFLSFALGAVLAGEPGASAFAGLPHWEMSTSPLSVAVS